jgi:hypothetical protein
VREADAFRPRSWSLSSVSTHLIPAYGPVMNTPRSDLSSGQPRRSSFGSSRTTRVTSPGISSFLPATAPAGFFFEMALASSFAV